MACAELIQTFDVTLALPSILELGLGLKRNRRESRAPHPSATAKVRSVGELFWHAGGQQCHRDLSDMERTAVAGGVGRWAEGFHEDLRRDPCA